MFCGDDETGVEAARTPSVSGIILAGGQARRMGGINKALIEIGGRTIIERIASTLSRVLSNILIVTNDPDSFRFLGLPMYRDAIPGSGSLGGLFTGLKVCGTDYGFLVGCDMPFLRADIISFMIGKTDDCDVIVPATGDYLEPLHTLYLTEMRPAHRGADPSGGFQDIKSLSSGPRQGASRKGPPGL